MSATENNPALSPLVRLFAIGVAAVLVLGGVGLFFLEPDIVHERWPWALTPFTTRFVGAIYLSELVAVAILAATNRWSPGRLALPLALLFTLLITLVSLAHHERFDFGRRAPKLWFALYGGSALISAAFLWYYRRMPYAGDPGPSPGWRRFLLAEGALVTGYGLLLLVAPRFGTDFWPWPIDAFHGRLYSSVFITAGSGALLLSRITTPWEWRMLGLSQLVLGAGAIIGTLIVDADVDRVDWSAPGTLFWLACFTFLAIAGAVTVWQTLPGRAQLAAARDPA